ncbi:MAG: arginine--tRNA ligase, partial [bacterium]|nr:arginine--tRNA ligase [bacterium]
MEKYRMIAAEKLAPMLQMTVQQVRDMMEVPPNPAWGDIAIPCFALAKSLRKAPNIIAADLASKLDLSGYAVRAMAVGAYLNITLDSLLVASSIIGQVASEQDNFGGGNIGRGKTIVIDYSSPNIAKPFGMGHIRTTMIGNSLARIYRKLGFTVVGVNHLGDWGTQFGKLIVAYRRFGENDPLTISPVNTLYRLYVEFHRQAETDPALEEEARAWFRKLEDGDGEARNYWTWFRDVSMVDFERIYKLLGVKFEAYCGESFYEPFLQPTLQLIRDKNLTQISNGAEIIDLEPYGLPPCLLVKSD